MLASSLGLSRANSCFRRTLRPQLVAQSDSAGPAPASPQPLQLPDFLRSTPPGRAPLACHWPLEAQPRSRLWAASSGPGLDLQWVSPNPASCPPKACTGPASASQQTLNAQLSPDFGLPRPDLLLPFGSSAGPRSCLPVASLGPAYSSRGTVFPGPAFAFWRPLQAPNFLRPAPPGPVAASRPPVQAQLLLLPAAAAGPAPASRQPLWTRFRPSSRSSAFLVPTRLEVGPSRPVSGLMVAPPDSAPALRQRLQSPDFLQSASPGPARSSRWPVQSRHMLGQSPPGPTPAFRRPPPAQPLPPWSWALQAQRFLPAAASTGPTPALQATASLGSAPA
nr:putative uncharacterized protein FLJ44672 [Macaca nemestrina]